MARLPQRNNRTAAVCFLAASVAVGLAGELSAQTTRPAGGVPTTQPATQPAMTATAAEVVDVQGQASFAVLQADGTYGQKQTIKKGDRLVAGTKIQTRLRSYVVLTFGGDTVVKIDPLTEASVDQYLQSPEARNVVLGLGHGMVRGGSVAPTLRSEMAIVTPTATLTKRGTFEFGLRYEAGTGRFRAYLTEEGLVDVLNRTTGVRRTLEPTQYVTQAMVRWIQTAVFSRWVSVQDVFGLTANETDFGSQSNTGQSVASPGGGMASNMAGSQGNTQSGAAFRSNLALPVTSPLLQSGSGTIGRAEGNFGARR
jgi:hypothetical protein